MHKGVEAKSITVGVAKGTTFIERNFDAAEDQLPLLNKAMDIIAETNPC